MDTLECKIEFKIDGDSIFAKAVDFDMEFPIEDYTCCLDIEMLDGFEYTLGVSYSADLIIQFYETKTEYGTEWDYSMFITKIKVKEK